MKPAGLPREEWNFGELSGDELKHCCLYEYAREAERELWNTKEMRRNLEAAILTYQSEAEENEPEPEEFTASRKLIAARERHSGRQWRHFPILQILGPSPKNEAEIRSGLSFFAAPPWLMLPPELRIRAIDLISRHREERLLRDGLATISPEQLKEYMDAGRLFQLHEGDELLASSAGQVAATLVLDIKTRSDADLAKAFSELLKCMRNATGYAGPKDKGGARDSNWEARLNGLALMRLRHALPAEAIRAEVEHNAPHLAVWSRSDSLPDVRAKIDKTRERVAAWFRDLYPELGPFAKPENFEPRPVG